MPPTLAWCVGDPHYTTFDNLQYTFNGNGEFGLTSISPRIFELAARAERGEVVTNSDAEATYFTYFGMNHHQSGSSVGFEVDATGTNFIVRFDKTNILTEDQIEQGHLVNECLVKKKKDSQHIILSCPDGITITVYIEHGMGNLLLSVPDIYKTKDSNGLFGTFDGDSQNDLQPSRHEGPYGTGPNGTLTASELNTFGYSWRVSTGRLFYYTPPKTFANINLVQTVPTLLNQLESAANISQLALVKSGCQNDEICIYDTLVTGNLVLGQTTKQINDGNLQMQEQLEVYVGRTFTQQLFAEDRNQDDVTFSLLSVLPNSSLTRGGLFTWTPSSSEKVNITFMADDGTLQSSVTPIVKLCKCLEETQCNYNQFQQDSYVGVDKFAISSCDCPIGRSGATCEEDFNPCVVEPCFPNVLCNDTLAPSLGFTCDTCPTGLMGDGFICQDRSEPIVACPAAGTVNVTPNANFSRKVVWIPEFALANDSFDGKVEASCFILDEGVKKSITSNDTFVVGDTQVDCTAVDAAGNVGSCTFTVSVKDNESPNVTCPMNIKVLHEMSQGNVSWSPMPKATDVVDGVIDPINITCVNGKGIMVTSGSLFDVGTTTVTCTAVDSSENIATCSFEISVNDNEAPIFTCPTALSMNVNHGTAVSTVTWSLSARDTVDGDVTTYVVCKDDKMGNTVMSGDTYAVGLTTVTCKVNDTALNEGTCQFNITVIDNEAPIFTCPTALSMNVNHGTAVSTVTWSLSASDTVDGDVTTYVVCKDDKMGNTVMSGDAYAVGLTTVTCKVNDTALNEGTCQFNITVIDNEAPIFTCPTALSMNVNHGTAVSTVTWSLSASDTVDGDVTTYVVCKDDKMGNTVMSGDAYAVGLTTVTCRVNDTSLNEGTCPFSITVIDNEAPTFTCPTALSMNVNHGTAVSTVTWSLSASDTVDGDVTTYVVCKDDKMGNTVMSGDTYAVGLTTVTCKVNDTALNEGTCTFNITVIDNEAPIFTCPTALSMNVNHGTAVSTVTWSLSASDTVDGDVTTYVVCKDDKMGNTVMSGDAYAVGLTTVTCRVNDTSLNEGTCPFSITVIDNEAPTFTCPTALSMNVNHGTAVSTVTWSLSARDTVDGDVTTYVVCKDDKMGNTVMSGDTYAVGLTTVTCKVNDTALNEGTCQFNINVIDNEAPIFTCPTALSMNVNHGTAVSTVTWSLSASDTVDGDVTTYVVCKDDKMGNTVMSGDTYAVGLTTVTCRVNDTSLNEGTCPFSITVIDNEAPTFTCPTALSMNVDHGTAVSTVTWSLSASDTVDGDVTTYVVCKDDKMGNTVMSGDTYAVGLTTVTCKVNDTALNEGTCTFNITVIDNVSPVINCLSDVVYTDFEPQTRDIFPTAVDVVDGVIDPIDIICVNGEGIVVTSGSLFNVGTTTVTCTAVDSSENNATCSFGIDVLRTSKFTLTIQVIQVNQEDVVFDESLNNMESAKSVELISVIIQVMNQTLSRSTTTGNDLIRISVVVFKRGSVIATVLLEYSEGSTVTPSDVQHVLEDDTIPDKELSDGVDVILVEPKSVVVDQNVTGTVDSCPIPYCSNGGTCKRLGIFPVFAYSCSCPDEYSGVTCDQKNEITEEGLSTGVIIMIILIVFAVIILLMLCICTCLIVRYQHGKRLISVREEIEMDPYAHHESTLPPYLEQRRRERSSKKQSSRMVEV
ncbi:uncharacterized protein LOC117302993 isoform X2 [Asterias rubens]|uniref:uncharacterized protein LOC117302993 isoform X2 n=1 Tax=Asterias rubens TaxID=7604 RepID=UPI0014551AC8|nr:uncharacterized protein LOC117302993 isoform X2 [Asterias rubens]